MGRATSRWPWLTCAGVSLVCCKPSAPPPAAAPPIAHPEGPQPVAPMDARTVPKEGAPSSAPGGPPAGPPAATPVAPVPIYSADDAVRDAIGSTLSLVGIGGWTGGFENPGHYRRLSCIYSNAQVIVVDVDCDKRETYQFEAVVISPRGRVELMANARHTTAALSKVQRADYGTFALAGAGPWAGPPTPSIDMSYDEIAAYADERSHYSPGTCVLETGNPQGLCNRTAPWHPADWASANASFFQDPPQDWYRLVRTLVALRAPSYAAADLGNASPAQLSAWAAAVGSQNDIDVADVMPDIGALGARLQPQPGQLAAAVHTPDGGMAYAGTRRGVQIVVARTDRKGARVWETVLTEPGIRREDSASLVACDGGFYVHGKGVVDTEPWNSRSPSVVNLWARHRVLKLDSRGRVLWKWYPPRRPPPAQIPQFFRGHLTPQGTLLIDGYVELDNDFNGTLHGWTAEVSPDGKTLRDEVGSVEEGDRNSKP